MGGARKGVAWKRGNLVGELRGTRMRRVRAGRMRVTLDMIERLGLFAFMVERIEEEDGSLKLTPGWSTMITASNSQTSASDNNLVKTSFKNGVELVERMPGRSRSRAPHLRYICIRHQETRDGVFFI